MKKLLVIISILTLATTTFADEGPSWDFVSLSYVDAKADTKLAIINDSNPDGFELKGFWTAQEDILIYADYFRLNYDISGTEGDINSQSVGIGYKFEVSSDADFALATGFSQREVCYSLSCNGERGYFALANIRYKLTDKIELSFMTNYIHLPDDSDTAFSADAAYYFTSDFSLGLGLSTTDEFDTINILANFNF
ncbi:MAG: hypothetical protein GY829_09300 [Gammaproteobacteria bacterium]|nr:hypothetical protein [Gammaproteobacteria bacterium]